MPWYWRLHIGDQCLWTHVFLIGFAFSADAVVALLIVGVSMTQSFKAGKRSSTHEQWQQPRVFFSTAALKDKFSMDAAMADERRVRLCGLPFLMNEAWLRNVLHSQDIRQPWKVVLLRKGEHRSWSQWQNAFLFYETQAEAIQVAKLLDNYQLQGWWRRLTAELARPDPQRWKLGLQCFEWLGLKESSQFHDLGWVLASIQRLVCLF